MSPHRSVPNYECVFWVLFGHLARPRSLPLYFQLVVESAALLLTSFQRLEAPLDLREISLGRMKGSLPLLELMLLLAQLLLLLQQLTDKSNRDQQNPSRSPSFFEACQHHVFHFGKLLLLKTLQFIEIIPFLEEC